MQGGLRGGTRLAQGSKVFKNVSCRQLFHAILILQCTIIIRHAVSVQVDGEPWTQRPCSITIERCEKQAS